MTLHKSQGMIAFKLNLVSGEGGGGGGRGRGGGKKELVGYFSSVIN